MNAKQDLTSTKNNAIDDNGVDNDNNGLHDGANGLYDSNGCETGTIRARIFIFCIISANNNHNHQKKGSLISCKR